MPTWGDILHELKQAQDAGETSPFDRVRRQYLARLAAKTGRETILYATKWMQGAGIDPASLSITDEDIQGLMEVIYGLTGPDLDLIIHSPGGSVEAAEAMLSYMRSKFEHIRAIIPGMAMSAATMLACGANGIVMGKHSFIGPIDPQLIVPTPFGLQAVPAQAVLEQFRQAQQECQDPSKMGSWMPMLSQYGPALLVQCKHAIDLSQQLASEWLRKYMFNGDTSLQSKADSIAQTLADHNVFKSHGRHVSRIQAKEVGLLIEDLESDQDLQDLVLSVYHASTHTFNGTAAVKIIENHVGRAFIKQQALRGLPMLVQEPSQPEALGSPAGGKPQS